MKVLGHRGCIYEPENTIRSFLRAFEFGADGVELDTQVTADGFVVVSHDENLIRLTGNDFGIRSHSYSELLLQKIEGENVPLLGDVLSLAKERNKLVDVELKNPLDFELVVKTVEDFSYDGFFVSSFFHKCLFEGKKSHPKVRFGYLYSHEPRDVEAYAKEIDILKPEVEYVTDDYRRFSSITIPWTVNEKADVERLLALDIFGVITDVSDKVLSFMRHSVESEGKSIFNDYLIKAIVKEESNISGDKAVITLQNKFMPLHLEKVTIDGKPAETFPSTPLFWQVGDKIVLRLYGVSNSSLLRVDVREAGSIEISMANVFI
ncbi:MAG: glycerophosphodiester phosphodiesterase [Caldisericaceae bacterium]